MATANANATAACEHRKPVQVQSALRANRLCCLDNGYLWQFAAVEEARRRRWKHAGPFPRPQTAFMCLYAGCVRAVLSPPRTRARARTRTQSGLPAATNTRSAPSVILNRRSGAHLVCGLRPTRAIALWRPNWPCTRPAPPIRPSEAAAAAAAAASWRTNNRQSSMGGRLAHPQAGKWPPLQAHYFKATRDTSAGCFSRQRRQRQQQQPLKWPRSLPVGLARTGAPLQLLSPPLPLPLPLPPPLPLPLPLPLAKHSPD